VPVVAFVGVRLVCTAALVGALVRDCVWVFDSLVARARVVRTAAPPCERVTGRRDTAVVEAGKAFFAGRRTGSESFSPTAGRGAEGGTVACSNCDRAARCCSS
jgi:hypothetical protein